MRWEIFIVMLKLMTRTCTLTAACSEESRKELKGGAADSRFHQGQIQIWFNYCLVLNGFHEIFAFLYWLLKASVVISSFISQIFYDGVYV